MARKIDELSAAEKVEVALQTLFAEIHGDPEASKTVASEYSLSTRAVTRLKNQALQFLKGGFEGSASAEEKKLDLSASSKKIRNLIADQIKSDVSSATSVEQEEEDETEEHEELSIDTVFSAIKSYNESKDSQFKIYPSVSILQAISGQSKSFVEAWAKENKAQTDAVVKKFNLNKRTNMQIPTDINLRAELGLG
jgi:hypothetical protein